jgi:hypothetical protein
MTRYYTVHLPPRESGLKPPPAESELETKAVFIRDGFSWFAFIVPLVFGLWHRQWLGLLAYVALSLAVTALAEFAGLGFAGEALFAFGLSLLTGLSANDWRRWRLGKANWREVAVVGAGNRFEAEIRVFSDWQIKGAAA